MTEKYVFNDRIEKEAFAEWGGTLKCWTADGKIVNCANELNRIEKEKEQKQEAV